MGPLPSPRVVVGRRRGVGGLQPRGVEGQQRLEADGEAQPLAGPLVAGPGVDADQVGRVVVEPAAAVAGVDGRLRLDDADRAVAERHGAELRDHPLRVRPAEPLGVADGEDRLPHAHRPVRLPERGLRLLGRDLHADQRQVDPRRGDPRHPRRAERPIQQLEPQLAVVQALGVGRIGLAGEVGVDDVPIRHDQRRAVGDLEDHARPGRQARPAPRALDQDVGLHRAEDLRRDIRRGDVPLVPHRQLHGRRRTAEQVHRAARSSRPGRPGPAAARSARIPPPSGSSATAAPPGRCRPGRRRPARSRARRAGCRPRP